MRNMGTMASMSVSILVDGALWGLISCHNKAPHRVPLQARNACDFLTRIFALQLAARERGALAEQRIRLGMIQARLLGYMAEEEQFIDGLLNHPDDVLALVDAAGAAVVTAESCRLLGATPAADDIRALHTWVSSQPIRDGVFVTDSLGEDYPPARAFAERASGLLAISISQRYASYVLWFRPEVVQTVRWGGNPSKPATPDPAGGPDRLHPRKSFETWKETVQGRSLPWSGPEIDAAKDLRAAVLGIVLRRAEELAALSEELQRSNKELEAFSYSVSHDLRAPFRHIVGYSELLRSREGTNLSETGRRYVDTIAEAALSAGKLVDNLLNFSQMGRNALNRVSGDMNQLVEEVRRKILRDVPPGRAIRWQVGALGRVYADPVMLRLVIENLLSNAVKYTRDRPEALIEIGREPDRDGEAVFYVRDNGVGFDMAYVGKLFGVFQRLHRVEEFEGTGIGLANVRRIVERHGGRTWAEGALGRGATFHFTLPLREGRADMADLKPILLVEDNPNDIELTLAALEQSQLANAIVICRDGAEALDYLQRRGIYDRPDVSDPAVVLLDLKLPKVDGLEVLATVKGDPRTRAIPVVMLTSSREESDLVRSYELGVNAFVVKPVGFKEFFDAIQDLGVFWAVLNEPPPHRGGWPSNT
ncbi:hypothetical protein GCM10025880_28800 [Methylorubrum aminovorans]|nr:hypothetical protein GCM10025880_28800 [Methylorubrum aminovorans]